MWLLEQTELTHIILLMSVALKLLFGPPDNFHLHMKALEQMINIRGGLQSIRSTNPQLEQYITWSVFSEQCRYLAFPFAPNFSELNEYLQD